MSLLMQALRKAERARSQNGHDPASEQEEPQFGQDAVPLPPPMEGGPAFSVMPDAWRLEPLDNEPPVIPAQEAIHDPVPPQARHEAVRHTPASPAPGAGPSPGAATRAPAAAPPAEPDAARAAGPHTPRDPTASSGGSHAAGDAWDVGRASARGGERDFRRQDARGVRAEGARPAGLPRAIASSQRRLMVLAGALAALLAVFAFIYWRALSGPGPGARLPMVPMPAPGSAQGAPAGASQGAAIPVAPYVTAPAGDPALSPGVPGATPAAGGDAAAPAGTPAGGAMAGGGMLVGAGIGEAAAAHTAPQAGAAPAPASKPQANVTIPTPEQLAAIPDPAIRAEAMRDAAERAAQLARTEGVPPPSSAGAPPAPQPAAAGNVPAEPERPARQGGTADAMRPERPPQAADRHASRQQSANGRSSQATRSATAANRANGAGHEDRLQTAVGENGDVRFVRGTAAAQVAPAVQNGYNALKAGDLAGARQHYDQALLQDPNNRDALLGSAAVALREHDGHQASGNYLRLLEVNPNDPEALAGLAELHPGDLQTNEVKLRGLARQHPDSGPVQFALGNLYARQGRWAEAQQSYFRAFSAVPDNADYAFNLAVGLDRLNQARLAQTYYRRALELAQTSPPAFNPDAVRKRLQALETPPQ